MRSFRYIVFAFALLGLFSCHGKKSENTYDPSLIHNPASASGKESDKLPVIEFDKTVHDFGEVAEGVKVSFSYKFTNKGNADLIISNCVPTCGCTVPEFPRHPIKPGKSDFITVVFDGKGREGTFEKSITVFTNSIPNSTVLYIKGLVTN